MSREFHVAQIQGNSCVAACVVMLERWRGRVSDDLADRQREVFARLAVGGYAPLDAAAALLDGVERCGYLDIDNANAILYLAFHVRSGCWALVSCFAEPLGRLLTAKGLHSPRGPLAGGAIHHALAVIGADDRTLDILDPWHAPEGQPTSLSYEEFVGVWTGEILIAHRT